MQTKKILSTLAAAFLFSSTFAFVGVEGPGPNGENDKGLCTAYFNGQKKGHDKNGQPGPFQALEDASREYTDNDGVDNDGDGEIDEEGENQDLSAAENVFNYCDDTSEIMGNPEHGRFTCSDDETGGNDECTENEDPGNGGGNGKGKNG